MVWLGRGPGGKARRGGKTPRASAGYACVTAAQCFGWWTGLGPWSFSVSRALALSLSLSLVSVCLCVSLSLSLSLLSMCLVPCARSRVYSRALALSLSLLSLCVSLSRSLARSLSPLFLFSFRVRAAPASKRPTPAQGHWVMVQYKRGKPRSAQTPAPHPWAAPHPSWRQHYGQVVNMVRRTSDIARDDLVHL